jgi:hypothetical protein
MSAEFSLHDTTGRRQYLIGCDCRTEKQIDIGGIETSALDCLSSGTHGKQRRIFIWRRFAPLFDSGARCDPLVRGLDHLREILIRQNAFRV